MFIKIKKIFLYVVHEHVAKVATILNELEFRISKYKAMSNVENVIFT